MAEDSQDITSDANTPTNLPRISIKFCTQCKWMLRAAYFAQELLSTFSTSLGEVALVPSTGGVFIVDILYQSTPSSFPSSSSTTATTSSADDRGDGVNNGERVEVKKQVLWDRKAEGGFPETKTLKRLVRDCIDPSRDLGHVDGPKSKTKSASETKSTNGQEGKDEEAASSSATTTTNRTAVAAAGAKTAKDTTDNAAAAAAGEEEKTQPNEGTGKDQGLGSGKQVGSGSVCEDCV